MRWIVAALLICPGVFGASPCLEYLRTFAAGHLALRETLAKMEQRWRHNEDWISHHTGTILGSRTTAPLASHGARIPPQEEPLEAEELEAIDALTAAAIQYELDSLYLGSFSSAGMRAQLRGKARGRALVLGLFPHPEHQDDVVKWLQNHPELAEVPRSVLTQPGCPVLDCLQQQTSTIQVAGWGRAWGNLNLVPDGSEYRLVVYGTQLDQSLGPLMGTLVGELFQSPSLRHLRIEIPAKLAFVSDVESFETTGTTSLHQMGPHELGLQCDLLAQRVSMFLGAPVVGDGNDYLFRLQNDRTVSLVFVP
jgi:hypothetical protein